MEIPGLRWMGSLGCPLWGSHRQDPPLPPRCQGPLTTAVVALVEGNIGACKIVDKLVLPNEESALRSNGIIDGGSKTGLRAVEGADPATVNVQLQGGRVHSEQVHFGFSPHIPPCGEAPALTTAWTQAATPRAPSPLTVK